MEHIDATTFRKNFPMLTGSHPGADYAYLDSAASSLTPEPVIAAMDAYYRTYRANVHRGMYLASAVASEAYEGARGRVAALIGARETEVVFTRGATESLNIVAHGLARTLGPGDDVVVTEMEHHANLVPWQQLALERGFSLKRIPVTEAFALDMGVAREVIGPNTKVLAVTWVSNVLGTEVPVEELAALAKKHGAVVVVDAAQAVGHRKVNVATLGADFLAFSAHKMFGPTGIGALWGTKAALKALPPMQFGGDMIRDVTWDLTTFADAPWKFEAGTPNIAGAIGFGAAADFVLATGAEKLGAAESELGNAAVRAILEIPGSRIVGPGETKHRTGVVSFTVEGVHPHDMATILDAEKVAVRAGHHCAMPLLKGLGILSGTTRASFAAFNTTADVERLVTGIHKARAVLRADQQ